MTIEILQAITLGAVVLGAIVNVSGLMSKRDVQVTADARRDVKLDSILEKVGKIDDHERRLTIVEQDNKTTKEKLSELCEEHKTRQNLCGGMQNAGK